MRSISTARCTANGPSVTAKIQQSGAEAFFTFSGTAGQRIFIDAASSSLPNQCGVLDLRDPAGGVTISGCIVNGKGGIAERDGYVLHADRNLHPHRRPERGRHRPGRAEVAGGELSPGGHYQRELTRW